MTIDKAIKNLTEDIANNSPTLKVECKEARELGLEALKELQRLRYLPAAAIKALKELQSEFPGEFVEPFGIWKPLPSETQG